MKRFLVVLFALGLIVAFSAPAAATDVKFSGEYYVTGYYDDNHDLIDKPLNGAGSSSQWYQQRLRVNMVFQVAEGLKLVTRFDAMEEVWGGATVNTNAKDNAGTAEQNISFERAYVQFAIPTGILLVGQQQAGTIGTIFGDYEYTNPRIKYVGFFGDWIVVALLQKLAEGDIGTEFTDKDYDAYALAVIKKFKGGQVGICDFLISYKSANDWSKLVHYTPAWFKWKTGSLYLEGEASWFWGVNADYDDTSLTDKDQDGKQLYLMANLDLGQFYVGGQFAFCSGDDPNTNDVETSWAGGKDYQPTLILWNEDLNKYMGKLGSVGNLNGIDNAYLYQVFAGMKPLEKLNIRASYTLATADEKYNGTVKTIDDDYGTEFDITATYKLYDNLTYMVGFGYLWTGDYFKADDSSAKIGDNYIVMNKLTLKF